MRSGAGAQLSGSESACAGPSGGVRRFLPFTGGLPRTRGANPRAAAQHGLHLRYDRGRESGMLSRQGLTAGRPNIQSGGRARQAATDSTGRSPAHFCAGLRFVAQRALFLRRSGWSRQKIVHLLCKLCRKVCQNCRFYCILDRKMIQ